jgi:hypothetical protein
MGDFNMPPGVRVRDIPGCGDDPPCAVCYMHDCVCPPCAVCGEHGAPECYENDRAGRRNGRRHAQRITKEQLIARYNAYLHVLQHKLKETKSELRSLKTCEDPFHEGDEYGEPWFIWSDLIGDAPDPDSISLTWG